MLANARRDTTPEMLIRRELHARGYRYRVDYPLVIDRRRRADIVFPRLRLAVFIDGCFWHGCPQHGTRPKQNADYWLPKLERNRTRDEETNALLADAGWTVLRFWEHEDAGDVVERIESVVSDLRRRSGTTPHAGAR
jgi:DNA mismatch endonuclease (patch repair protein)